MVLLFGVVATSTTILSVWTLHKHMTQEYISKGRAIARSIASSSVEVLLNRDLSTIQSMIDQFLEIQGVAYVFVEDGEQNIISHTFVPEVPAKVLNMHIDPHGMTIIRLDIPGYGNVMDISKPILAGVAGHVHVGMDMGLVRSYIATAALRMQALMFFIFWGSVLLLYLVMRKISKPLQLLTDYAHKLRQHDFKADVRISSNDEIGMLADTMRTMADELSSLIATLEQKVEKATSELTDTLAYLEGILDNMADGLLVVDRQDHITLNNPALLHQFGLPIANFRGKRILQFFPSEISAIAEQSILRPGEVFTAEVDLHAGRYGKAVATAIRPREGRAPIGAVILVSDITAEKEVDLMKTEFITTVSHELRTPLTSVLGFAKIIKKKLETDIFPPLMHTAESKQQRTLDQISGNLEIIVSEGQRLTELINDVLDIAKMESGKIDWRMHEVSLQKVVEHAFSSTRSLYEERGLRVFIDITPDLPIIIADADRLIQVMVNLISNAVKFTQEGYIKCSVVKKGDSIVVSLQDTGGGIAAQDQEAIFERFRQAGGSMTDKPRGTGLGLPICKEIIEYHNGRLWVESTLGKGSTFFFSLPITQEMADKQIFSSAAPPSARQALSMQSRQQEPPLHLKVMPPSTNEKDLLLVVDDDPSVCAFLKQVLETEGYEVLLAHSGQEALELAAEHHPSLITMDLLMPGMDGETAISKLRQNAQTRKIPVVVISAVLESRGATNGDAELLKPIDEDSLLQTIHGLLHLSSPMAQKCLVLNPQTISDNAQFVKLCSGEITQCPLEDVWSKVEAGFKGTVVIPTASCERIDLSRLASYPDILVIVLPA